MSDQPLQPHQKLTEHLRPGERVLWQFQTDGRIPLSHKVLFFFIGLLVCASWLALVLFTAFGAGYPEALPIAFQFGIAAIGIVWSLLVAGIAWKTVTGLRNMVYAITNRQIIVVPAHWPYPTAKAKLEEVGIPVVTSFAGQNFLRIKGRNWFSLNPMFIHYANWREIPDPSEVKQLIEQTKLNAIEANAQ